MNHLVRDAHQELDAEVYRLGAAYQRTVQEAAVLYQQGLMTAQMKFESKLHEATQALSEQLKEALVK